VTAQGGDGGGKEEETHVLPEDAQWGGYESRYGGGDQHSGKCTT
jgi:hypothetical protein